MCQNAPLVMLSAVNRLTWWHQHCTLKQFLSHVNTHNKPMRRSLWRHFLNRSHLRILEPRGKETPTPRATDAVWALDTIAHYYSCHKNVHATLELVCKFQATFVQSRRRSVNKCSGITPLSTHAPPNTALCIAQNLTSVLQFELGFEQSCGSPRVRRAH